MQVQAYCSAQATSHRLSELLRLVAALKRRSGYPCSSVWTNPMTVFFPSSIRRHGHPALSRRRADPLSLRSGDGPSNSNGTFFLDRLRLS